MMPLPLILLTNDDGVDAPGLLSLRQTLADIAEVVVFAPNHNWSAAGHTKTMHKPMRAYPVTLADGSPATATTGAPSDCVALALLGLLDRKPNLVVSGINLGANLGFDITYSGTVAGAMEGVVAGIPGIACSQEFEKGSAWPDFRLAAQACRQVIQRVLEHSLPDKIFLNVNVPLRPAAAPRIRVSRLGKRVYRDKLIVREDPRGQPYYWIGGEAPTGVYQPGTDVAVLQEGDISVTPLSLDLTATMLLDELSGWAWQHPLRVENQNRDRQEEA